MIYVSGQRLGAFIADNPENEAVPVQYSKLVQLMETQEELKDVSRNKMLFRSILKTYLKKRYNVKFNCKQKEEITNYIFQSSEHLFKNAQQHEEPA